VNPHRQASKVLKLAATEVDETEAARRLLVAGLDVSQLGSTRGVIESLDLDPGIRDRALLLLTRTQLLAERSAARAAESDRLRAEAAEAARPHPASAPPDLSEADATALAAEPGRSLGMLVHELRTPLTVAQMAAQYLTDHLDEPATVERMSAMVRRNTRMALYLLDHLALTEELRTGELHLDSEEVDLAVLVVDCVQDVRQLLPAERPVEVTLDEGIAPVLADPSAIRQVIFNLLVNAAKYSPTSTPIEVTVHRDGFSVRDHGRGVEPAERERIFQEGSQLDPAGAGSGLGLFISRRVASAHGGDLVVEAPADGGSRFSLRLPIAGAGRAATAEQRQAIADLRDAILDRRERLAGEREAALRDREDAAADRDLALERREAEAADRDLRVGRRETSAEIRDLRADQREQELDRRDRTAGDRDGDLDERERRDREPRAD
jgi:signal transduction histidine kinase